MLNFNLQLLLIVILIKCQNVLRNPYNVYIKVFHDR